MISANSDCKHGAPPDQRLGMIFWLIRVPAVIIVLVLVFIPRGGPVRRGLNIVSSTCLRYLDSLLCVVTTVTTTRLLHREGVCSLGGGFPTDPLNTGDLIDKGGGGKVQRVHRGETGSKGDG